MIVYKKKHHARYICQSVLYNGESRNSNYDDLLWVHGPRVGNWSWQRAGVGTSSKNRLESPLIYIYIYIYMCVCVCVCGASISFQTFFVQAFKIVVDISWDDRPISMILGLNEQLQQQLEFSLLKPDCHSWWISKMQSGREDTLEERYAIKFCFTLRKNATYGMLQTAFGASCMNRVSVFKWHNRLKEGRESVRDDERCGRSKEVNTPELIGLSVRFRSWLTMLMF